jgi:hypothetical protein
LSAILAGAGANGRFEGVCRGDLGGAMSRIGAALGAAIRP